MREATAGTGSRLEKLARKCKQAGEADCRRKTGQGRKLGLLQTEPGKGRKVGLLQTEPGKGREVGLLQIETGQGRKVGLLQTEPGQGRKVGLLQTESGQTNGQYKAQERLQAETNQGRSG